MMSYAAPLACAGLLLGLSAALLPPSSAASITFSEPALVAEYEWPQDFIALGYDTKAGGATTTIVVGALGPHIWELDNKSGTQTWEARDGLPHLGPVFPSHCSASSPTCERAAYTFGVFTPQLAAGQQAHNFNATKGSKFSANPESGHVMANAWINGSSITFRGLPKPIISGRFTKGGIRTGGTASIRCPDGTLLATLIVTFAGQENLKYPDATSIVVYRSVDEGLSWDYVSTLAEAKNFPWSQEGPNEMDLELGSDGSSIIAVMRFDGGDGPVSHPYVYYHKSTSVDSGATWSTPVPMPGTGCARPRLRSMGGKLLLSGGRLRNENTSDILLWVDPTGMAIGPWERYSISYWHNRNVHNASLKFDANVNSTTFSPRETNSYTSLLRLDEQGRRGVILYDMRKAEGQYSFAMEFALT